MKKLTVIVFVFTIISNLSAQQLLSPSFRFSKKDISYVTLENGTEVKGTLNDIDRKKGLIKLIKIEDGTGTVHKLKPGAVKYMYAMPSGFDKAMKAVNFLTDAQKWNNEKLSQDLLDQGYVYFETVNVKIKKKTMPMMMQLLNPTFSKSVKVYHDPFAKETVGVGVGGVTVAGGLAKSYYMMLDSDNAAYKIEKKQYKKSFPALWDKCSSLSQQSDINWNEFTDHVIGYTECDK
ncbi:MAG: hypothetical protein OEX02_11975 [Cyclobacteriaceae bacterium]|nr:hypothetical protein [Cyclobacteriaceae bacterium]